MADQSSDKRPKNPEDKKPGDPAGLNSPKMEESGKITVKAVSSASQAWEICKGLRKRGEDFRNKRNAVIMEKYNGQAPFNAKDLGKSNQGWRNNYTTHTLASVIDRILPQFKEIIKRAKYLLNAKLPVTYPDATEKARKFNERLTNLFRSWGEWGDFINLLTQEDVVIGYATPAWLEKSDLEWRPWIYRSDEIYFPDGTGQKSGKIPVFMVEEEVLIYEFLEPLKNKKAAIAAGYNWENCVELVNTDVHDSEQTDMDREDAIREGRYEDSFKVEAKTITLFHLVVREYNGGVDLWTIEKKTGKEVQYVEGLHENMDDATTLFTMQTGNGKLYGSKGLGRYLVNLHTAIERGRNLAADQMYLSGLVIIKADPKDINGILPVVRHPFVFLPDNCEVVSETIQFDANGYILIDQKLVEIMEAIAGSFIPPQIQESSSPTKIEAAAKVERQERVKQGVLGRFFGQFAILCNTMKKKVCSALNMREAVRTYEDRKRKRQGMVVVVAYSVVKWMQKVFNKDKREAAAVAAYESKLADREAVEALVDLLEQGLTVEEIGMLRESFEQESMSDEGPEQDQNTLMFIEKTAGNPGVNQDEALRMSAEIMLPPDRRERLIIDEELDQTIKAEAARLQTIEFGTMTDGFPVGISPRDNHTAHREALLPMLQGTIQAISNSATATPQLIMTAKLASQHYRQHVEADPSVAANPEQAKAEVKALDDIDNHIAEAEQAMAELEAQQGQSPETLPAPVQGTPAAVMTEEPGAAEQRGLDALAQAGDLALREREISLAERQQTQQEQDSAINAQLETARLAQEQQRLEAEKEAKKTTEQPNSES